MATVASPFVEMFRLAIAGFAEGHGVLSEAPDLRGEASRPLLVYGYQAFVSGFIQLEALARRYMATPEGTGTAASKLILSDPGFRFAATECAKKLDDAVLFFGIGAERMAIVLRRWIETNNPAEAQLLVAQCDTVGRMVKMKAGRAA